MNFRIIFLILCCTVQLSWAQKDTPFKTSKLKLNWDEPAAVEPASTSSGLQYKSILEKDDSYLKRYSILKKDEQKTSVLEQKTDFKNPGDEFKKKLNKEINEGSKVDVFFGKFKVSSPIIKIMTRDHMDPDGDKVRIILNDVTVVNVINLDSDFKTSYIDLREGDNLIDIVALNQGLAGPNTATFAIYDENDNLITSNDWNLNTGVAAKFIIEYVKPMDKK